MALDSADIRSMQRCEGRLRSDAPVEPLIQSAPDGCRSCWACVRYCPAKAIRVVDGHSEVIHERCVKCGACVTQCGHSGHIVRDDTGRVRDLLASGRPVVALLATEFVAALHPLSGSEVERALEGIGFYAVESTAIGEELVAAEYERSHARPCATLTLRSTCPVTVEWVRRFYPSLASALTPIVPPYIAQARLIRRLYPEDVAVVYVSPCFARKDEVYEPGLDDAMDAAIDFTELEALLASERPRPPLTRADCTGAHRPEPLKEISLTDGFPRRTVINRDMTNSDFVKVRGLRQLDELLSAVMRGEAAPVLVDMLNCEGCIDGPAVRPGMSVFAKRNVVAAERAARPRSPVSTREILAFLPPVELLRTFDAAPVTRVEPSDEEIDACLSLGEFASRDDTLDCGACGYATCVEHAVAILHASSTWEMCFPLQRSRLDRTKEALERCATLDSLTGLQNRRVFDESLAREVSRSQRYGTQLSLVMLDVDGFKGINDLHGHLVGDAVLCSVGRTLNEHLRDTDIPTRYGGDEFALILPGIGKTPAYAVAEKLRTAIAELRVSTSDDGGEHVSVTVSAGVASVNGAPPDGVSLLEAADAALYRAKQSGRDRVMIAPG